LAGRSVDGDVDQLILAGLEATVVLLQADLSDVGSMPSL
jgi:hypothetical protein